MWKEMRHCNLGAIVLVAAAIVIGGVIDIVPATTWGLVADIFQDVALLLSACVAWAARPSRHSSHTLRDARAAAFVLCFDAAAGRRSVI